MQEWEDILPGYSTFFPETFRKVLPFLLASLAYHREFLELNLPENHTLRLQRVWTSKILVALAPKVLTGIGNNSVSGLTATGVPIHIILANRIVTLEDKIDDLLPRMEGKLSNLPNEVKAVLLNNFAINGAYPLTEDKLTEVLIAFENRLKTAVQAEISTHSNNSNCTIGDNEFDSYTWGGHIHPVPANFRLPVNNVKTMWDLWLSGDKSKKIAPYRFITGKDLVRSDHGSLSKLRFLMNELVGRDPTLIKNLADLKPSDRDKEFEVKYLSICSKLYPTKSKEELDAMRIGERSYITIYELLKEYNRGI